MTTDEEARALEYDVARAMVNAWGAAVPGMCRELAAVAPADGIRDTFLRLAACAGEILVTLAPD